MQEKSFKEIEQEYERRKLESSLLGNKGGHWQKCPRCNGTTVATCEVCKGLGHIGTRQGNLKNPSGKVSCNACGGTGRARCNHPACQGGWVWVSDKTA
jgi:hypothetical protein